jgi:hypothetical protein
MYGLLGTEAVLVLLIMAGAWNCTKNDDEPQRRKLLLVNGNLEVGQFGRMRDTKPRRTQ